MRAAQNLNRFRIPPSDVADRPARLEDDLCSLSSWSDALNRSNSRPSSVESNGFVDLKTVEKSDLMSSFSKNNHGENRLHENDKLSAVHDKSLSKNFPIQNSMAASTSVQAADRRSNLGRGQDSEKGVRHDNHAFPPSLDLKSASFEYRNLWENPLPHDNSEEYLPSMIKKADARRSLRRNSQPKELSSRPLPDNTGAQRLYPNLDRFNSTQTNSDENVLYPKIPKEKENSSKISPSRPRFFDVDKKVPSKYRRDGYVQYQNTSPSKSSTSAKANASQKLSPQSHVSDYFKSQPIITTQQRGISLKSNNSSDDLESMNKQMLEHRLEPDNMKSKMLCVWNNFKYGWTFKSKSSIKLDSPLFLLGKVYHKRNDVTEEDESEFLHDFISRIWLTYRSNFYPIPGTKLNTDCGWGCMLRSAQMLLAQCLVNHFLGREWRYNNYRHETQSLYYKEIIRWFTDPVEAPSDTIPFCLHHLVSFGRHYSKEPGEWYGPASVAYICRDALSRASISIPILSDICIYVAQDCTVYIEDINQLCRTRSQSDSSDTNSGFHTQTSSQPQYNTPWRRSLIIFIPVRLGGVTMNEIYSPCIKSLLSYNNCMGIIGGKPKHSLYFLGWQEEKLIYLDPHYCREAVDSNSKDFSYETYHCLSPRKLSINKMDPSCTIGFYIKSAHEFEKFVHDVTEFVSPPKQKGIYPLFIFSNGSQADAELAHGQIGTEQGRVKVKHYVVDEDGHRHRSLTRESEEFIML